MRSKEPVLLLIAVIVAFGLGVAFEPSTTSDTFSMDSSSASANIVAAAKGSNDGEIGEVKVQIIPGDGDVLVETDPFVQADTQFSATKAREVAEEYTGKSLSKHDVIYEISMDSQVVGGPSAGAAMTLATIAAMTDKEVKEDSIITGTITESGRIGKVGEIPVKAYTAGKEEFESFYVPRGQSVKVNYKPIVETERRGFFRYRDVEYRKEVFNISSYTRENFGMKTEEASNIYQAADKILK